MSKTDILVVEDDPAVSVLVQDLLKAEGHGVRSATDLRGAKAALAFRLPDLVLLDLNLPDGDGLELAAYLRQPDAVAPCGLLMLSARNAKDDVVKGLEGGADDYLAKPFHERELLARVAALLRRREPRHGAAKRQARLLRQGAVSMDPFSHEAWLKGQPLKLTRKEFEILKVFLQNPGKALSREEIINTAWGGDLSIVQRVVDVHVGHLRQKLADQGELIETIPQVGFKWKKRA